MKVFSTSIDIAAPPDRVYPIMADVERWHEWTPSISSVKRLGGGPFAVGARAMVRQPKLLPAIWKVTEVRPGESFTWVSSSPGVRVVGVHRVEPTPNGSRVTLAVEMHGMLAGLFARLTGAITTKYIDFEAKGLKSRSESAGR